MHIQNLQIAEPLSTYLVIPCPRPAFVAGGGIDMEGDANKMVCQHHSGPNVTAMCSWTRVTQRKGASWTFYHSKHKRVRCPCNWGVKNYFHFLFRFEAGGILVSRTQLREMRKGHCEGEGVNGHWRESCWMGYIRALQGRGMGGRWCRSLARWAWATACDGVVSFSVDILRNLQSVGDGGRLFRSFFKKIRATVDTPLVLNIAPCLHKEPTAWITVGGEKGGHRKLLI